MFLSLLILAAPPQAPTPPQAPPVAVAKVEADSPPPCIVNVRRHQFGGSGTVVGRENGKSLILTNRHVAEDADGVTVTHGGRTYPAECVAYYAGGDLVLFSVDAELPCAEIAETEPPAGAVVEQWGFTWHGQGRPIRRTAKWSGVITGYDSRFVSAPVIETGIVSESGDSGSAVFYDGKVVAVTWGKTAAVPLAGVRHFLRQGLARLFPRLAARLAARRGGTVVMPAVPEKAPPPQAPPVEKKVAETGPAVLGTKPLTLPLRPVQPPKKEVPEQAPPVLYYYPPQVWYYGGYVCETGG